MLYSFTLAYLEILFSPKATIQDYFDRFLLLAGQYHIFDPRTGYIDRDQSEIRYENLARPSAVLSAQNAGVDTSTPPIQKRSASRITPEKSYIQSLVATSLLQLTQTVRFVAFKG